MTLTDRIYEYRGEIAITLSSSCFGLALVWQKTDTMTPVVLSAFRQLTSFLCILVLKPIMDRLPGIETQGKDAVDDDFGNSKFRMGLLFAVLSGIGTVFGGGFQQVALTGTSVTKVAFLQAFTVFAVPVIDALIFCSSRTTSSKDILAASLSVIAMYFLSNGPSDWNDVNIYDIFVIICDFGWAINICFLNLASTKINNMTLAIYDFATAAFGLFIWAFCVESERAQLFGNLTQALADSGNVIFWTSFAQAIGAIFCNIGMMTVSSSKSIIIMTTEALWSAAGAYIFLAERLTTMEVIGCVIMVVAQLLAVTKIDSCELETEQEPSDADETDKDKEARMSQKSEKMDVEMVQGKLSAVQVINYHSITSSEV